MRYKALLIDADDTLFDFPYSEGFAIAAVIARLGISDPGATQVYHAINNSWWALLEAGETTAEALRTGRFRDFAAHYNIAADAEELATLFLSAMAANGKLLPGALGAMREIATHMPIAIVTNGLKEAQIARVEASEINQYISTLIISGELGYSKPDPRIMHEALRQLNALSPRADITPKNTLMVGDRLQSDILGANNARIDAVWYNPKRYTPNFDAQIDYEINDMAELVGIALSE